MDFIKKFFFCFDLIDEKYSNLQVNSLQTDTLFHFTFQVLYKSLSKLRRQKKNKAAEQRKRRGNQEEKETKKKKKMLRVFINKKKKRRKRRRC